MSAQRVSPRVTLITWIALVLLAAASLGLSQLHLGAMGSALAIAIAAVKAVLVAMIFMELSVQRASNRIVLVTAVAFVVLLASLAAVDVATRAPEPLASPRVTPTLGVAEPERGAASRE